MTTDVSRHRFHLLLVLPEAVNFPDGQRFTEKFGKAPGRLAADPAPTVTITFYQRDIGRRGRTPEELAVGDLQKHLVPTNWVPEDALADMTNDDAHERLTIVHATTTLAAGEPPIEYEAAAIRGNLPGAAPFNRCLGMVDDYCRALQAATWTPYERVSWATIRAGRTWVSLLDDDKSAGPPNEFRRLSRGFLAKVGDVEFTTDVRSQFEGRMGELRHDQQSLNWLDRFYDAQRAYRTRGDYAVAMILLQTASEILIDTVLTTLYWETGEDAAGAAEKFVEGGATRRLRHSFQHLLGGYWGTDRSGPVADWFVLVVKVRNRVVHAGYQPTDEETSGATDAVLKLQNYMFNRVAAKNKRFARSAMILMGEEGLKRRGVWTNATANWYQIEGDAEESWLISRRLWRETMYHARDGITARNR